MSCHDPNLDTFAARVKRIEANATNTCSTLYVGMDLTFDGAAIRKKAKPRKSGKGWMVLALAAPLVPWLAVQARDQGFSVAGLLADPMGPLFQVVRNAANTVGLSGLI
jgi:hypothetical protein